MASISPSAALEERPRNSVSVFRWSANGAARRVADPARHRDRGVARHSRDRRGLRSSAGPAPFVSHALGPHDPSFLLDRRWDDLTRVSIAGGGVAVRHDGTALKLTATGTGSAPWTRHAWGVERPTSFGRESIVVAAPRTEEYLTVQRRLGSRTWRWQLESGKSVLDSRLMVTSP